MSTINQIFHDAVAQHRDKVALRHKVDKAYQDITYGELAQQVEAFAGGLVALGLVRGDRVAILSENCPEWAVADLAALAIGAVIVPLYPTLPAAQIAFIVGNSGARLLVSDSKQLKKATEIRALVPTLEHLVGIGATGEDTTTHPFADVLAQGKAAPLADYAARWQAVGSDDLASLVYTSGTTGDPKGAMLTHNNFVWDVDASLKHYAGGGVEVGPDDTFLSFLPLSHAYERTTGYYLPLRVGATIAYSEGVFKLSENLVEAQPTIMVCVPRIYEAFQDKAVERMSKAPETERKAFEAAIATGKEWAAAKEAGHVGMGLSVKRMAFEKLVYGKARERFGGKLRFFVSGGAALSRDTALFFAGIGLPISEGYGMTEASPVMSTNPLNHTKVGTVGTVLPGAEFRIAADGEILYRGPNVMRGYWQNEAATRDVLDGDGWLHTGDVGVLDGDGYLKITDRKKDIIVLGNGKNVAPQPIEGRIKQSPFISEIVLIGEKQSTITALVLPNKTKLTEWASAEGLTFADAAALFAAPETRKKIKSEIDAASTDLADFEKVKRFALLDTTFSVDGGEMTPTLKIKRKVVMQKYAREISEMRGGGDSA